jgi:hypothetical protein
MGSDVVSRVTGAAGNVWPGRRSDNITGEVTAAWALPIGVVARVGVGRRPEADIVRDAALGAGGGIGEFAFTTLGTGGMPPERGNDGGVGNLLTGGGSGMEGTGVGIAVVRVEFGEGAWTGGGMAA